MHVNAKALASITKSRTDGAYRRNGALFHSIFNFQKFGYESLEDILSSENNFACYVQTDGFGVCFGFARKAKSAEEKVQLNLDDFESQEVQQYFQPCAFDPNRKSIFIAKISHEGMSKK